MEMGAQGHVLAVVLCSEPTQPFSLAGRQLHSASIVLEEPGVGRCEAEAGRSALGWTRVRAVPRAEGPEGPLLPPGLIPPVGAVAGRKLPSPVTRLHALVFPAAFFC